MEVDDGDRLFDSVFAIEDFVAVDDIEETVAHDVHPPGEHDEVGFLSDDDAGDLYVVVVAGLAWVGLEVRLEA